MNIWDPYGPQRAWTGVQFCAEAWWDPEFPAQPTAAQHQIEASGFANSNAFGAVDLRAELTATGYANANAFGTVALQAQIDVAGFANAQAFGQAIVITVEPHEIEPTGFENVQAFGEAGISATLAAAGFANAQAFGTVVFSGEIDVAGFANAQAFGTPALNGTIAAIGIASTIVFGTTVVQVPHQIEPVGFANTQAFGQPNASRPGGGRSRRRRRAPAQPKPTTVWPFVPAHEPGKFEHQIGLAGFANTSTVGRPERRQLHVLGAASVADQRIVGRPLVIAPRRRRNTIRQRTSDAPGNRFGRAVIYDIKVIKYALDCAGKHVGRPTVDISRRFEDQAMHAMPFDQ